MIASGPSAGVVPFRKYEGRSRVVAVNESWRLCPWADVLYAHDYDWWNISGGRAYEGLKIAGQKRAADEFGLRHVRVRSGDDRILTEYPGEVGSGGNSGFQAINLAVAFGVTRIALVGFDLSLARGLHWHGSHARGLRNPTDAATALWRKRLDAAAPTLERLGVEVINTSPTSTLTAYRKAPLEALWKN